MKTIKLFTVETCRKLAGMDISERRAKACRGNYCFFPGEITGTFTGNGNCQRSLELTKN